MKIFIKIILLTGILGYLIFAFCRLSLDEDRRICHGLEIIIEDSTSNFVDREFVESIILQTKCPINDCSIKDIDVQTIEDSIRNCPYIDSVLCHYTSTNILCIRVIPRKPVLHIMSSSGENYYMDINGNDMPIADYINNTPPWNKEIQQIYVKDPKHIEFIPSTGNHTVIIGEPIDIEDKLNRLQNFYQQGLNKTGWNKYSTINLNYANQIVCTKKNKK